MGFSPIKLFSNACGYVSIPFKIICTHVHVHTLTYADSGHWALASKEIINKRFDIGWLYLCLCVCAVNCRPFSILCIVSYTDLSLFSFVLLFSISPPSLSRYTHILSYICFVYTWLLFATLHAGTNIHILTYEHQRRVKREHFFFGTFEVMTYTGFACYIIYICDSNDFNKMFQYIFIFY